MCVGNGHSAAAEERISSFTIDLSVDYVALKNDEFSRKKERAKARAKRRKKGER